MDFGKALLLGCLLFQNTFLAITIKASQNKEKDYIPSTVVFLNEVVKFIVCLVFYLAGRDDSNEEIKRDSPPQSRLSFFFARIVSSENLLFVIPCVIYAIQNNIVFIALKMVDAALYQVLANLKIITTGLFSVFMLSKSLHRLQWMALVLLTAGEALAEASAKAGGKTESSNVLAGTMLMVLFATLSGFAGVFTEKMMKQKSTMGFYLKSMIFYFWGSVVNGVIVVIRDWGEVSEKGFFYGYTSMTILVLCLLAFGGLLVSVVITQFDNITKVYVTCMSIFTTSVFSYFLFNFQYNLNFVLSAVVVCISILIYNDPATVMVTQMKADGVQYEHDNARVK